MKVLVTGAGGYIGSIAVYELLKKGFNVIAVDNFSTGYKEPLVLLQGKFGNDRLKVYQVDLSANLDFIFEQNPDIVSVLHYAAFSLVSESMEKPGLYFKNNVCGSLNLLQTLVKYNVKNLIFSSTCAVYGNAKYIPIDETHPTEPTDPYGESKLAVERMVKWFGKIHSLSYVILRYFNVVGASDDSLLGYSKKPSMHLVENAVKGALGLADFYLTCAKVDTPDKTPIRDYVNVIDLNEAHILAMEYLLEGGTSQIINLGSGTGDSVLEIIHKIQKFTGKNFDVKISNPRLGEYPRMLADITKAKRILGWEPKRNLEFSVKTTVEWYKNRPQGWSF